MNIVIGVCGIGYGHVIRQQSIIDELNPLHRIVVLTFGANCTFIKKLYPDIKVYEVSVPWIYSSSRGIQLGRTARHNRGKEFLTHNFKVYEKVMEYFGGPIDIAISDYEPCTAQLAYMTDTRLVTVDQQSKYLGYQMPPIGCYSRIEERARLGLFFPMAHKRIAMSFHEIEEEADPDFHVKIVPAVIRKDMANFVAGSNRGRICVYLSPHSDVSQGVDSVLATLGRFSHYEFEVYAPKARPISRSAVKSNIRYCGFSEDGFARSVLAAEAVITTAGHTLIAELIHLKKPVYAVPLGTYDQQYCAQKIESLCFGEHHQGVTSGALRAFLNKLDDYRHSLDIGKGTLVQYGDRNSVLRALIREAVDE